MDQRSKMMHVSAGAWFESAAYGRQRRTAAALVAAALLLTAPSASAQECASPAPEWVFCDDFEASADQNGNLGLWDDQGLTPSNLVLTSDPAIVRSGQRSLEITAHMGMDTGGGPTKWFLPGHDEVYVRFWARFEPSYNYTHHLVFIGASEASNQWAAFGTAGCRPSGTNFFTTSVEPFGENGQNPPPGAWGMYTYSVDMQCDPGSNCANYADPQAICDDCATKGSPCNNGLECCWGANNISSPPAVSPLGQWVCLEARVQANSGGQANGSQTLWVDEQQAGEWTGFRWRTDDALKINSLGLWHYVTDGVYAPGQTQQTIWFDDVVISTARIGCGPGGNPATGAGAGTSGSAVAAGATTGAGAGGGPQAEDTAGDAGSCGCIMAGRPARSAVWLLALVVAALARRRLLDPGA